MSSQDIEASNLTAWHSEMPPEPSVEVNPSHRPCLSRKAKIMAALGVVAVAAVIIGVALSSKPNVSPAGISQSNLEALPYETVSDSVNVEKLPLDSSSQVQEFSGPLTDFVGSPRISHLTRDTCSADEVLTTLMLETDGYALETSWEIQGPDGEILAFGPPTGTKYERITSYVGEICLPAGKNVLVVNDGAGDGLCCKYGKGKMQILVGDQVMVETDDSEFKSIELLFDLSSDMTAETNSTDSPMTTTMAGSDATNSTDSSTSIPTNNSEFETTSTSMTATMDGFDNNTTDMASTTSAFDMPAPTEGTNANISMASTPSAVDIEGSSVATTMSGLETNSTAIASTTSAIDMASTIDGTETNSKDIASTTSAIDMASTIDGTGTISTDIASTTSAIDMASTTDGMEANISMASTASGVDMGASVASTMSSFTETASTTFGTVASSTESSLGSTTSGGESTTTNSTESGMTTSDSSVSTNGLDGDYCVTVELFTDNYGKSETAYAFSSKPDDGSDPIVYISKERGSLENDKKYSDTVCVPAGKYELYVEDSFRGLCCASGQGYYVVQVDGVEILYGGNYATFRADSVSHDIIVGDGPTMSARDEEWLIAHNTRRQTFHEAENTVFRPLVWSSALAEAAANWLPEIMAECNTKREQGIDEGENLSFRLVGSNRTTEGPENILNRWVNNKVGKDYPENQGLTQVMWRATRYLGCADGSLRNDDGNICYASICRYARAGNCAMGQYDDWKIPTLADATVCGPVCPDDGCH